jgi:beta-lactamase superfamily II metal-dependent hydrolase
MGADGKSHAILIDSGFKKTYRATVRKVLQSLEQIDIWVLTHIDKDHINGAIAFAQDPTFQHNKKIRNVWFNHNEAFKFPEESSKIGFAEGISFKTKFLELGIPIQDNIWDELPRIDLFGMHFTILSPNQTILEQFKKNWKAVTESSKIASAGDDYHEPISNLAILGDALEDKTDLANRSSIAFLMEHREYKILFLGDAHASIVVEGVKKQNIRLGLPENTRLKVDYVKLAHHGSKHNFAQSLLDIIDCSNFIISAKGGGTYHLPNKEVFAKILRHPKRDKTKRISFLFNYDNATLRRIFFDEELNNKEDNFECVYPTDEQNALILNL